MDFNLKQWRDQQHESEDDQLHHHQQQQQQHQSSAKIPRYLLLQSPQQQQQQQQHQQQQQEIAALPLFVSSDSQPNKISTTHLSSSSAPTAIPTRGRYSFSLVQWQELELQALIYRHIVAGASVPPELLQLVKKSLFASSSSPYYLHHYSPHFQPAAALLQAGYWGKGAMDPEPGRCRRTDGKKWRCSRDVVAGHKYCERHMHRGRNRSRKPVEFPAAATASASANNAALVGSLNNNNASPAFAARSSVAASANETPFSLSRSGASFDAFQLNRSSDKKTMFGPQSSVSGDGGRSNNNNNSNNRVLMHLFDDWPRSDDAEGNNLSSTSLSISAPGNPTSDFLRLSTGNGDELGQRERNGNGSEERDRGQQMSWGNGGGWGGNSMGGGPLAEALRSSSNSSPTSVLHQLPRCSAPDTSFVSA